MPRRTAIGAMMGLGEVFAERGREVLEERDKAKKYYDKLMQDENYTLIKGMKYKRGMTLKDIRDLFDYIQKDKDDIELNEAEIEMFQEMGVPVKKGQKYSQKLMRHYFQQESTKTRAATAKSARELKKTIHDYNKWEDWMKRVDKDKEVQQKVLKDIHNVSPDVVNLLKSDPATAATFDKYAAMGGIRYEKDPNTGVWQAVKEKFGAPKKFEAKEISTSKFPDQYQKTQPTQINSNQLKQQIADEVKKTGDINAALKTISQNTPQTLPELQNFFKQYQKDIVDLTQKLMPLGATETGIDQEIGTELRGPIQRQPGAGQFPQGTQAPRTLGTYNPKKLEILALLRNSKLNLEKPPYARI